ncbi:MAG: preprotein translocase subunit SecG [Clostridia bacterium]|nr:preprotein translocase subunit SecG [Clostridia bacterium]
MEILKTILIVIYVIVCLVLIVIASMQSSEDDGASNTIMGGAQNNSFYEKNKGRTREGKLKRWTIILGITFIVLTIVLGIVYML